MKKYIQLITGQSVEQFEKSYTLSIQTHCPQKYMLIDLETGVEYEGSHPLGENRLSWTELN